MCILYLYKAINYIKAEAFRYILGVWQSKAGTQHIFLNNSFIEILSTYHSVVFNIFIELCNHRHDLTPKSIHHPKRKPHTHEHFRIPTPRHPQPLAAPLLLSFLMGLPILNTSYKWNHTICALSGLASFTWHHVFELHPHCTLNPNSLLFYCRIISHCMDVPHFVDQFASGWVFVASTLWLLWMRLLWTLVGAFHLRTYVFTSLWDIPRSGIAGSYGTFMFNLSRNCRTVFQSSWTLLHSHQQYMRFPISQYIFRLNE